METEAPQSLFLEQKETFMWHPEMLLEGARIQISCIKDLVTLRNPRSRFTFINYLFEKGRLVEFLNLHESLPTRAEYNDYFAWVAGHLDEMVEYSHRVKSIEPVLGAQKEVEFLRVTSRRENTGEEHYFHTRNIVLATGGIPSVPLGVELEKNKRILHTSRFLQEIHERYPDPNASYRFVVVGAGQSGAEIFQYLYTHFPNSQVTATLRRHAYKPADGSQFVNEVYNPEMVDTFYELDGENQRSIIDFHYDTNYAVVDAELIQQIYAQRYQRKVEGRGGIEVRPLMTLDRILDDGDQVIAEFTNGRSRETERLAADGIVLATGYKRPNRHPLLEPLEPFLEMAADGQFSMGRDYRIRSREGFLPGVYLQGFCEHSHGLSDSVLSVLSNRAGEIADAIVGQSEGVSGAISERVS